jgi:dCMP deaminase
MTDPNNPNDVRPLRNVYRPANSAFKQLRRDIECLGHAWIEASKSKCVRAGVGAVATSADYRILVSGFNGTASGQPECCDVWTDAPTREQHREWSDKHEIHAEMNLAAFAAKLGISLEGSRLYCTKQPCWHCLKVWAQLKPSAIVYDELHSRNAQSQYEWGQFCRDQNINAYRIEGSRQHLLNILGGQI